VKTMTWVNCQVIIDSSGYRKLQIKPRCDSVFMNAGLLLKTAFLSIPNQVKGGYNLSPSLPWEHSIGHGFG
jgi:hypothetical protein